MTIKFYKYCESKNKYTSFEYTSKFTNTQRVIIIIHPDYYYQRIYSKLTNFDEFRLMNDFISNMYFM